LSAH